MLQEDPLLDVHYWPNGANVGGSMLLLDNVIRHYENHNNKFIPALKLSSIGLRSGEYGGRNTSRQPDS
jgi:hypothetical protein